MPAASVPDDDLIGITIAGRYRIISRLGAGGMGTAYRAWDEQDGVPVVIKIPKKVFLEDPKFAERFHREIRLLQGLTHPHIVPIVDVGTHEGLPFVGMRFLPGGSLSNRRLRDESGKVRPNPPGMLHLWLPAVAEALDHVHSQGVVHRDVKPANIFFDAFWGAYLGDFGIAKVVEESDTFDKEHTLTATHMGIGTQEYMCPEQFTPKAVIDGRADQYALAVMVYEMVAGTRPFTGATAHLIVEVTTQQPPPLQVHRYDLPISLVDAVHRGLAKRPEERFVTCREFASAVLRDVPPIEDEPGVARLLCPKCSNILKLPTQAAGRKGSCPKCRTQMKVAEDLGALWLLDEARRQRKTVESGEASELDQDAGVVIDYTEDEALEAFKPVSSTTPIKTATGRQARKLSPVAIWGGLAAALIAAAVIWNLWPEWKRKLTYEEKLAKAEATLKSDPSEPAANELLGRHWCFREQDWDKGLPYLAKSKATGLATAAQKELDAKKDSPASSGDRIRAAMEWWKVRKQPNITSKETVAAITKHVAAIYLVAVGDLAVAKDIDDANRWLERDSEFRALVGNKRPTPPKARPDDAQAILAQPPLVNSIGMKLKLIPAGSFQMGTNDGEADEKPVHEVQITKPFYLGVTEVTNTQWKAVMGSVPSRSKEDDGPVEMVSWDDVMKFCETLSALPEEKKAGRLYRLPTEAEWEYACRCGTKTRFSCCEDDASLGDFAWFSQSSNKTTHPVGTRKANQWGLHDMHGNVWEWCSDWHGSYGAEGASDPTGPVNGAVRVGRGGCWDSTAAMCRSTSRGKSLPSYRHYGLGLRLALSAPRTSAPKSGTVSRPSEGKSERVAPENRGPPQPPLELKAITAKKPEEILALPPLKNSIGVTLKLIPAGTFQMGSNDGDPDEKPVHQVRITRPFYLGVTEVTNAQWRAVMGNVPSHWKDDDRPVEQVSWDEVVQFCGKLSALPAEKAAGRVYRLPTEAEWEYACRGGTKTKFSFGDNQAVARDFAWFGGNADGQTHPVGQKKTNPWGLHDMQGNVWEWCSDWYGPYGGEGVSDPTGPVSGSVRVFRGGCWIHHVWDCRSARRFKVDPAFRVHDVGFRLALSPFGTNALESGTASKPRNGQDSHVTSGNSAATASPPQQPDDLAGRKPEEILALPSLKNSIGVELKLIPVGEFQMGSKDGDPDERPVHEVRITKPFYLGVTEVTNAQWKAVMGSVPSHSKEDDRPVEMVSWDDAIAFCLKLSAVPAEKAAARSYRLPSEAEWEYACRAGTTTRYSFGDDDAQLIDFAWFDGNARGQTHPVGQKKANPWGLLDMHGNVFEWCNDWSGEYNADTVTNPTGPTSGSFRVYRGGSGWRTARDCRAANRDGFRPAHRVMSLGFRVALTVTAEPVKVDRDALIRDTVSSIRQLRAEHRTKGMKLISDAKIQLRDQLSKEAATPESKAIRVCLGVFQRHLLKDLGAPAGSAVLSSAAISPPVGLWSWEPGKWIQLNEDGSVTASWHDGMGLWRVLPDGKSVTLLPHGNRAAVDGEISPRQDAIRLRDGRVLQFNPSLPPVPEAIKPALAQLAQELSGNATQHMERETEILNLSEARFGQTGASLARYRLAIKEALKAPDEAGSDREFFVGRWKLAPRRIIELLEDGRTKGSWHNHWGIWTLGPDGTVTMMISAAADAFSQACRADDGKNIMWQGGGIITREEP